VKVGIFVQTCDAGAGRMFGVQEVVQTIERAEELGFDSVWMADHLFIERPGAGRLTGHDPLLLIASAAVRTRRIRLGTLVVCPAFRTVGQLARESAALADASAGRFILGLGCGWHQPEFDAFEYPFDHLVGRFEEQLAAVHDLLAGGRVTTEGRYVRLREAEVLATAPPPPIWIASKGPRMLRLTARYAEGWNLAWGGPDPAWLEAPLAGLNAELEAAGRERSSFTVSAGISWVPDDDHGTAELARMLAAYEAAGVDLAILSLAAGPVGPTKPEYLDRVAEVLARD
jgi:alkanesulfonate monooxygenase SsuD/methylene tetrahydromethanopterin reductase-like flavin-dependent oxidoreductase (luciferase family)